jgi:hypothetical protein
MKKISEEVGRMNHNFEYFEEIKKGLQLDAQIKISYYWRRYIICSKCLLYNLIFLFKNQDLHFIKVTK